MHPAKILAMGSPVWARVCLQMVTTEGPGRETTHILSRFMPYLGWQAVEFVLRDSIYFKSSLKCTQRLYSHQWSNRFYISRSATYVDHKPTMQLDQPQRRIPHHVTPAVRAIIGMRLFSQRWQNIDMNVHIYWTTWNLEVLGYEFKQCSQSAYQISDRFESYFGRSFQQFRDVAVLVLSHSFLRSNFVLSLPPSEDLGSVSLRLAETAQFKDIMNNTHTKVSKIHILLKFWRLMSLSETYPVWSNQNRNCSKRCVFAEAAFIEGSDGQVSVETSGNSFNWAIHNPWSGHGKKTSTNSTFCV